MDAIEKIINLLSRKVPGIKGIYFYGSRARGKTRPESDYDVAILSEYPHQLTSRETFELALEAGDAISSTVDLVDLRAVPLDLRFEVVARGKRIYCVDSYCCDRYEMTAISMYQRFEEERKELVEAYKKRILSDG